MKKVWVIILLVSLVLLPGCGNSHRAKDTDTQVLRPPTSTVDPSGKSYFQGPSQDTEPTAEPAAKSRTKSAPGPAAPRRDAPVAKAEIEPAQQLPVAPVDLPAPSVGELEPVKPDFGSISGRSVPVGPGLVAVNGVGARALSILYPRADYGIIQVDKSMPDEVRLKTPFTYVITITNLTDTMLTEITLTETIAREFEFKGSEPVAKVEGMKLTWDIDSLGPKSSRTIKVTGAAAAPRPLEHSTSITHTVRDTAVLKVVEPSLELRILAPAEALLCEPIQVEFMVTNIGTGAAPGVQIVSNLPAGLQTVDGQGKVTLEGGIIAAGESRRFATKLRATKIGAYVNKATVTSSAGLRAESEAVTTTIRQPILTIVKSGPKRQYLGRPVAYEIAVTNKGDGPAQNTTVEDIIPPGVTGIEATSGSQFSGSKLVWDLGTLEPNASKRVRVSYTPTKEGEVLAAATAAAYCAEPVTDSIRTVVTGIAAPHLEVVDIEDPVEIGGTTTYVITVTNEGSAADNNIRLVCSLDDKIQYVSSAGATAGSIMGKTVSFGLLRSLEPKSKATWRVIVRGAQAGDVRFKVAMHTDMLSLPVEVTEATHIYQQFANGQ